MNLRELTQEVNSALDYNPDLAAYKDQVARVLNRHYLQISSQYPWLFMQKLHRLTLRKDITGAETTKLLKVGRSNTYSTHYEGLFGGTSEEFATPEMLGNYLVINDTNIAQTRTAAGHGGHGTEYVITGIFSAQSDTAGFTTDSTDKGTDEKDWPDAFQPGTSSGIVVDRPIIDRSTGAGGTLNTAVDFSDWKIEFRRYWLPSDCVEVLGIMDRGLTTPVHSESSDSTSTSTNTAPNKGRIMFLDSLKEEYLYLDRDNSGDPVIAMEGESFFVEPPPAAPLVASFSEDDWTTTYGGAGSPSQRLGFAAKSVYEYCYTFVYAGVESPPSPVVSITHPDEGDHAVKLYGLIDTQGLTTISDSLLDAGTGMIKRIYRRKVGSRVSPRHHGFERWHHIGDLYGDEGSSEDGTSSSNGGYVVDSGWKTASTAAAEPDSASDPKVIGWPQSSRTNNKYWTYHDSELHKLRVLDESGPRQSIQVYRPPSEDMDVEIRYVSRPTRLVADADTPAWPPQYHHVLVYKSLADICLQHGMTSQSQLYERKGEDLLDRMKQKYLARANRKYVRRGFDRTVFAGERWGTPSKI